MKKLKTKLTCLSLVMAIIIGTMTAPAINPAKTEAAEKAYGAKLKLNNEIKLNTTKTFKKKGFYQGKYICPKKKTVKINYTIKCSRKEVGDNYKVTYNVNYKYLNEFKVPKKINAKAKDIYNAVSKYSIEPKVFYTVFDYKTGKSLEESNKLGVKVKGSKWKQTYYPEQIYYSKEGKSIGPFGRSNTKTCSCSFTVTYPKKYKDIVVGIGIISVNSKEENNKTNTQYWDGKVPYGKTSMYKKGKKTVSYMRLNK